jgi:hypothetical protein
VAYLAHVKLVDEVAFAEIRRVALKAVGRITSSNAEGFIIDLDYALENAGILDLKLRWRGDDDCGFTALGRSKDDPEVTARRIVAVLADKVTYGDGHDAAAVTSSAERVRVSFLTWTADIGVAIVCIDVTAVTGS